MQSSCISNPIQNLGGSTAALTSTATLTAGSVKGTGSPTFASVVSHDILHTAIKAKPNKQSKFL